MSGASRRSSAAPVSYSPYLTQILGTERGAAAPAPACGAENAEADVAQERREREEERAAKDAALAELAALRVQIGADTK